MAGVADRLGLAVGVFDKGYGRVRVHLHPGGEDLGLVQLRFGGRDVDGVGADGVVHRRSVRELGLVPVAVRADDGVDGICSRAWSAMKVFEQQR